MQLFTDRKSSNSSAGSATYQSANDSTASSLSSVSSFGSYMDTPSASPTALAYDHVKLEDYSSFHGSSIASPARYGNSTNFGIVPQELMAPFQDQNALYCSTGMKALGDNDMSFQYGQFQSYAAPHVYNYQSSHGLPCETPSLDMDAFSPTSTRRHSNSPAASMHFVDPNQTFYDNQSFDMQSPTRSIKMQWDSPNSRENERSIYNNESPGSTTSGYYTSSRGGANRSQSASTTPNRPTNLRHSMFQPLQASAALHRVQSMGTVLPARRSKTAKQANEIKRSTSMVFPHSIQKAATRQCSQCPRTFQRSEHLKRHERTHNGNEWFHCPFCDENGKKPAKKFNRSDNLKSHVLLHTYRHKKASRTPYHPDALAYYNKMGRKKSDQDESHDFDMELDMDSQMDLKEMEIRPKMEDFNSLEFS